MHDSDWESCKSLKELDLRHNAIGPEGAKRLAAMMEKKNFALSALDFAGNKLSPAEEAALVGLASSARRKPAPKFKAPYPAQPPPTHPDAADVADVASGGIAAAAAVAVASGEAPPGEPGEEGDENKDANVALFDTHLPV